MKRIVLALLCIILVFNINVFAKASEDEIIEMYRLSQRAVEFMREHNVDFSLFEGAEVYPED